MTSPLVRAILFSFLFLLCIPHLTSAETKTFIKDYTYQAGDEDSKNSSRTIALREVKRLLLEELGTYLESQTEIKNFQMTKDQITTLTAGIVSTEVIEDTWDGKKYWLKAKIAANTQDVIKSIDNLRKDRAKVKELEELEKKSDELLRENARLSKELKIAKGGTRQKIALAYKRNIDNISATEWFEKGNALLMSDNISDAVQAYTKTIELNPLDAKAYFMRGCVYVQLDNYQQALTDFNKAIELNPLDAKAHLMRGLVYGKLGNNQQEIKDYNRAIELNPSDASAYFWRGAAYSTLGNNQQAIKNYDKAIELGPQQADAYYGRGHVYFVLKNYQQAIRDYDKAIELNPRDSRAYEGRGFAFHSIGNYAQAIKDFDMAIELNPSEALTYFIRGLAYGRAGNNEQSIKDIKVAARLGLEAAHNFLKTMQLEW